MDLIMFDAGSSSAANDIATSVKDGSLWGVSMGTTSKASVYSNFVLVETTSTRISGLLSSIPNGIEFQIHYHNIDSFTDSSPEEKFWFLRGRL